MISSLGIFSFESQSYERFEPSEISGPAWMSDSRRVVVAHDGKLFLLDSRTKASSELLASSEGWLDAPVLSHDDRTIYFVLDTEEADIWLLELK